MTGKDIRFILFSKVDLCIIERDRHKGLRLAHGNPLLMRSQVVQTDRQTEKQIEGQID